MTLRELWERAEPTVGTFLDQILAVPGVDGVYVGPNDLAAIHCAGPETAIRWREAGFRMLISTTTQSSCAPARPECSKRCAA